MSYSSDSEYADKINRKIDKEVIKKMSYAGLFMVPILAFFIIYNALNRPNHPIPAHIVVSYAGDPDLHDGQAVTRGTFGTYFSVSCNDNASKNCIVEIHGGDKSTSFSFPYVHQEWYGPHSTKPYFYTLDVIKTFPSENNNSGWRCYSEDSCSQVFNIAKRNGWVH